jgi:hypothetical protein
MKAFTCQHESVSMLIDTLNGRDYRKRAMTNKAARQLGKLGKGKPKQLTPEERERRRKRLEELRKRRWPKK